MTTSSTSSQLGLNPVPLHVLTPGRSRRHNLPNRYDVLERHNPNEELHPLINLPFPAYLLHPAYPTFADSM